MQAFSKLTEVVDGEPRILSQPPLIVPIRELFGEEQWKTVEGEVAGILRDRITGIDGVQRDFCFRQFRDWKGSIEIESMVPKGLAVYARLCGGTLARAHARSGDRIAIAAYLGKSDAFDQAIAEFSVAYADQNERDYETMQGAIEAGRLEAVKGL